MGKKDGSFIKMNPNNPYTFLIEGDISRADLVGLHFLCKGKSVCEYGVGGSTLYLEKIASKLICYDTSKDWVDRVKKRLSKNIEINLITNVPEISECDVLWIDGANELRLDFFYKNFDNVKECFIFHGSRPHENSQGWRFLSKILENSFYITWIKSIDISYLDSNLLVIWKRQEPLLYENWHETEKHNNRGKFLK